MCVGCILRFYAAVATPPKAIVFGSGNVTMAQMIKSGFALNIIGIMLVTLLTYSLVVPLFGIVYGQVPAWTATWVDRLAMIGHSVYAAGLVSIA